MRVHYDRNIQLTGIGVVPWTRLGPERWFDDYQILSIHDWDLQGLITGPVVKVFQPDEHLKTNKVQALVDDPAFERLAKSSYANNYFLPYKPITTRDLIGKKMLMNDIALSSVYENKARFREKFAGLLKFAPYEIFNKGQLTSAGYGYLLRRLGSKLVLQHESLSGGRGTYLVQTAEEFDKALAKLPAGRIVVSSMIKNAVERSVQVCATRYGVFAGSLQRQIIRDPLLCNLNVSQVSMFCGGEVGTVDVSKAVQEQIDASVQLIGNTIYQEGYRGIFGLDVLIKAEEIYILEVNARLTGMTPLLTTLYHDEQNIPFYLLHILELGDFTYTVADTDNIPQLGSQLILQSQANVGAEVVSTLRSGIYRWDGKSALQFRRADYRFQRTDNPNDILIQAYLPVGSQVKPGERLAVAYVRQPVLNAHDALTPLYRHLVTKMYDNIELRNR